MAKRILALNLSSSAHQIGIRKKQVSLVSVVTLVSSLITGISLPANATNDISTYFDEGFNGTGFFNEELTGVSDVSIKGVILNSYNLRHRRIVATVENGKALLRAYVPTAEPTLGYVGSWSQPAGHRTPDYDYQPDMTFGTSGVLDLGFTNVTQFMISKHETLDDRPAFLVSTSSGSHHIGKFNTSAILKTCTTSCPFTSVNITSLFTDLLGAGSTVPSAFASDSTGNTHVFVTGKLGSTGADAGKPYALRLALSDGSIANSRILDFPTGYTAGWSYTPVVGGIDGVQLTIAGNLADGSKEVGLVYRLTNSNLTNATTGFVNVLDVGTASTTINFVTNYYVLGGSYKDTGSPKRPLLGLYSDAGGVFRTSKLEVSSANTTDETLLSANYAESSAPTSGSIPVMAIGTDSGKARVYTWASHPNQDNVAPAHSEQMTFGSISGTPASAYIPRATFNNFYTSGLMAFVGFNAANSTISISAYQSALAFPGLTEHVTVTKNTSLKELQPSRNAGSNPPSVQGLTGNPTMTWYNCTAQVANPTALQSSAANPPAGCTAYTSAEGASIRSNGSLEYMQSNPRVTGHFLVGFSYSNPTFNYYSASVELTTADITSSSGGGGSSPSLTSPAVSAVTPLRAGAEISFTAPAGNPAGTTYRVTALEAGNSVATATSATSPVIVAGLQDGVSYTFRIQAISPTGTVANAGTTSSAVSTLQPGSTDTSYFSSTVSPSVTGVENTLIQPSGNIYVVSSDVRRILPTGLGDSNFGTSGTYALPGGLVGTVIDVVEDPMTGNATPAVYVLVQETSTNDYKVVKLNYAGVLDTSFGTSGIFTPQTQPTAPANPLGAQLTIDQSGPVIEVPGVELPGGSSLGTNFVATDAVSGPAGTSLAGANIVVGTADGTGGSNLVISVVQTSGGSTTLVAGFNSGAPITITRTSGTTSVGGVSVDAAGNIYVLATINGSTKVLAYAPNGTAITTFGNSGELVIAGASGAIGIEVVGERVLVTTSDGSNTTIRAAYTPAGFNALSVAVGSNQGGAVSGSGPVPFAGPVVTKFSRSTLVAGSASAVTITGQNLAIVTSLAVGTTSIPFTRNTAGELVLNIPALPVGTYDLRITYSSGAVVVHQSAFRVLATGASAQTLRITNLRGDRFQLTTAARNSLTKSLNNLGPIEKVICTGSTSGTRATAADRRLAQRRAEQACSLVKRLRPEAITEIKSAPASGIGARFRSVTLEFVTN